MTCLGAKWSRPSESAALSSHNINLILRNAVAQWVHNVFLNNNLSLFEIIISCIYIDLTVSFFADMVVVFRPSQVGATTPLPYTASPLKLLVADVILCLSCIRYLPGILLSLRPCPSGKLDELYPSRGNLTALAIHGVLIVYQVAFLLSLPLLFFLPIYVCILYVTAVFLLNNQICAFLNGRHRFLVSHVPLPRSGHESEHWIFINGVGVGYVIFTSFWSSLTDTVNIGFKATLTGYL